MKQKSEQVVKHTKYLTRMPALAWEDQPANDGLMSIIENIISALYLVEDIYYKKN